MSRCGMAIAWALWWGLVRRMKTVSNNLRGLVIAVAVTWVVAVGSVVMGHIVPQWAAEGRSPALREGEAKPAILDWTGPERMATVWR